MPKRGAKPDVYEAVFGALAHPARRRVLMTLYFNGGSMTAGDIAGIFEHAWQTTTRHLQVLEAAGLVTHHKVGRLRIYQMETKRLALVGEWLEHFRNTEKNFIGGKHDVSDKEAVQGQSRGVKARRA